METIVSPRFAEFSQQVEAVACISGRDEDTSVEKKATYFKNKEDRVQLLPLRFVP